MPTSSPPLQPRPRWAAAAQRTDVVEQPTWQIVAPDVDPTPVAAPLTPSARPRPGTATERRQWPAKAARVAGPRPGDGRTAVPGSAGPADRRPRVAVGRVEPRGRVGAAGARTPGPGRRPAVRQLRAVTLRHRPVLPPVRDLPGRLTALDRSSSRTLTQAAPYSSAWKRNDSQASAMNAVASEPARAATPTSRGARNVNAWVRNHIASPATIAGRRQGPERRRAGRHHPIEQPDAGDRRREQEPLASRRSASDRAGERERPGQQRIERRSLPTPGRSSR